MEDFKGRAKRLDDLDLPRIGHQIGVGEDELHAFLEVEASGTGFDSEGRPKMLFEPHVFYRNLSGPKRDKAVGEGLAYPKWGEKPYPRDSYPRLFRAMRIDQTAALKSASWGLTQILGENHRMVNFETVQAMVLAFMDDEEHHLQAAVNFLVAAGIDDDLRELAALTRPTTAADCVPIVRVYNGPGYRKNNYHVRFAAAHNKWRAIKDTPWQPDLPFIPPVTPTNEDEIRAVQKRLDEIGYPEVGAIDGRWGTKTRAAVLAFRADNDLPLSPGIDKDLLAALMAAGPRYVAPARAEATVNDLREKGAEDIKAADLTQVAGGAAAVGGVLGAVNEALEQIEGYSSSFARITDALGPSLTILGDNMWLLLGGVGGVVVYQAYRLKLIRLGKHQTGRDVSE